MTEEKIILYSTNCTNCKILEILLKNNNISYELNTNLDYIISIGITNAPTLEVNGRRMNINQAKNWIDERKANI